MSPVRTTTQKTASGHIIAEIVFDGGDWQTDDDIRREIREVRAAHDPDAILLDVESFRYHGGDYALGFIDAFFDRTSRSKRPACFVGASGELANLFNTVDKDGVFGIRYFGTRGDGSRYLEERLGQTRT